MEKKDYYTELGLAPPPSEEQITKSFRRLAMKYHPDRGGFEMTAT